MLSILPTAPPQERLHQGIGIARRSALGRLELGREGDERQGHARGVRVDGFAAGEEQDGGEALDLEPLAQRTVLVSVHLQRQGGRPWSAARCVLQAYLFKF